MNKESKLFSCDNSGIVYAQCISFPTESKTKNFTLACTVKVVAKALRKAKPGVEKKKKYLGLIISLKKISKRPQGVWFRSSKNKFLCMNETYKFLGSSIRSSLCRDIRTNKKFSLKYKKIVSYSRRYF